MNKRYLDMVYAHLRYSDKPFLGSVTAPEHAEDFIIMTGIWMRDFTSPSQADVIRGCCCLDVWRGIVLKACGLSNVRRKWVLNKRSPNAIPGSRFRGIKPNASDHDEEQNVIRAWPNEIPRNCSGAPVDPKGGMLNAPRAEGRTRNRHGSRGGC